MSQVRAAFQSPESVRLLESQGKIWSPPHDIGNGVYRWLAGDIVELARLKIPLDVSSKLIQWEYEFRDPKNNDYVSPSIFGSLDDSDVRFFVCVNYNQTSGIIGNIVADLNPYFVNIGAGGLDSLRGWPGVPLQQIEGHNAYVRQVSNRRELACSVPLTAGSTVLLIARFYVDINGEEYTDWVDAKLAGRMMAEIATADTIWSDSRMKIGPR